MIYPWIQNLAQHGEILEGGVASNFMGDRISWNCLNSQPWVLSFLNSMKEGAGLSVDDVMV